MKRNLLLAFIGIVTALVLGACGDGKYISNEKFTEYVSEETSLEKEEEFIIYAFARSCSHCAKFKPVLTNYLDKEDALNIYAYDVDNEKTHDYVNYITKQIGISFEGTPTTIHIKNGKMVGSFVGTVELEAIPVRSSSKDITEEEIEIDLEEAISDSENDNEK